MNHQQTVANTSRRAFLKTSTAATGGLIMGVSLPLLGAGAAQAAGTVHTPNAWVHIADDNRITLMVARSEMGQGVYTSMSMLIAEELNVGLKQVQVVAAPPAAVYVNALLGAQITGGSTSVRDGWDKLRVAGAQVRQMLLQAAANQWSVDVASLKADQGMVTGPSGRKASYGQLAEAAAKLPVPDKPALKDPKDFVLVGKRTKRIDTPAKVNGTAEFGIDVKLPGMVYASLAQCPVIGGKVVSLDAAKAKSMPGVIDVVQIPDGVAVVAASWWQAKKARDTLTIQWDEGAGAQLSSEGMINSTRAAAASAKPIEIAKPQGDVAAALKGAAKVVEAEYVQPLQAHVPLEPMNFTAHVNGDTILLVGPTQFQQGAQGAVAAALGVKPEAITLKTTYLGGGFGRRLELDFIVQAAQISKAVNKPVKLVWTREDDFTHDFYRPVAVNQLKAGLDASGKPVAMHFKVASQSVTQRAFGLPANTLDPFMAEASVPGYNIPNTQHDLVIHDAGLRVGYWRAVSHNMNAFANESFIDELALAAGQDPYRYRLSLLEGKPRFANVLKLAAEKAGWGQPLAKGRARGIALMEGYDTYMAQVAEVSLNDAGEVHVHRVTVAVDPGHMVNPDTVEAQIQSSIVFGMGAALKHQITLEAGRVQQTNYNTFQPVRMFEAPKVDIVLVQSQEKPGGIGEPATAVVGPAIANAVAALTGKRIRRLPITAEALKQA
ncbi:MAG: xanthine dehydrogenase family protein molybdopterin-binding subunit [Curvibacter lanceolatus]|jgi:isoquinoline 1-oxidoreductase beta subunit|uniref:xanthine dehydrogenase family protein molybdopterin-binding subunit n=1 Tax=Curvibacter lanceolatus TaxID=86182 RepID=UPI00035EB6D3|nr:xanthine dehydrogenase family protein molybdopterin-binding subunit [Curvibacter lanceolatus]MBV5291322.1 xanthine dehydrogenase family protein molybdopterin-binding subunit [Curvibacter lanceolatus]